MGEQVNIVTFRDQKFTFLETVDSRALIGEIFGDNYGVLKNEITFSPGDVVIDAGANEGMFSVMIGKLFPEVSIIALEPVPRTYVTLLRNLTMNGVENVRALNVGVGGRPGVMVMNVSRDHSGGSSAKCTYVPQDMIQVQAELTTLDQVFEDYAIDRCRLLKMDIEGMEYEAMYPCQSLHKIDYMVAEIHMNSRLDFESRRPDGLINWLSNHTNLLSAAVCKMAE